MDFGLLQTLIRSVPRTHEVGGVLLRDRATERVTGIDLNSGPACVDRATGARIHSCSVEIPPVRGPVDIKWHTHPDGNRPSSVDMCTAMREGRMVPSYVVSPHGAWSYSPTSRASLVAWRAMSDRERHRTCLHWKVRGALLEAELQVGDADAIQLWKNTTLPYLRLDYVPRDKTDKTR